MMTGRNAAIVLTSSFLYAACAGDDDNLAAVSSGIYEIERWSLNELGCDAQGPSVLDERASGQVVIGLVEHAIEDYILVQPCTDRQDCLETLDDPPGFVTRFGAVTRGDADGFTGHFGGQGAMGDVCRHWINDTSLTIDQGVAHFERRTKYVDTDRTGVICDFTERNRASDGPCREFEALTAQKVGEL